MSNEVSVRDRATGAILRSAILSWQTLLTVAVTGVLFITQPTPFQGWQPWFWLVGGALAEVAFVVSNLTDPDAASRAVSREFEEKFDISQVKNPVSRQRLQSALEYRRNMVALTKRHGGAMRVSLQQTVEDVNDWIKHMYDLALHVDAFEDNELVERDRKMVPQQIEKVQTRLDKVERDPQVRAELENQLRQLKQQFDNLEATANSAKRAQIQLDSTLSSLGTIYAQISLLGTKDVDSAKAQRLRLEIQDEVASLQDTISALDEVQGQRLALR